MIAPLADLVEAAAPHLPPELVSPDALVLLKREAARIPSKWAAIVIESRLTTDPRTDLIICATAGDGGQRELAPIVRRGRHFGSTQRVLEQWTDEGDSLAELPVMWLEYDLDGQVATPDPFPFVTLWKDWLGPVYPRPPRGPPPAASEVRAIAERGLTATLGNPPDAATMDVLEVCAARLPMHGRLLHAVQRPRPGSRDVRIGAVLPTDNVPAWLSDIGWTGTQESLDRLLRLVGPGWSMLHVQVEFGPDGVRPLLSVDYNRRGTEDWDRLGDDLVREGAALPEKAAAAAKWIGAAPFVSEGATWKAIAERRTFYKLTARADGSVEAKAYMNLQARYVLF